MAAPLVTRVEESNIKLLESERKLQEERHRTVVLEQHLEKMRLEPARTSTSQRAAPRSKTGRAGVGAEPVSSTGQPLHQGGALPAPAATVFPTPGPPVRIRSPRALSAHVALAWPP